METTERPLFIVLRARWFVAFAERSKTEEWRRHGSRWNAETCRVGRAVTLAKGFSGPRVQGRVVSFRTAICEGGAGDIYGHDTLCAVIGIELD
jgi:hypothetical protein